MNAILRPILNSPLLPAYIQKLEKEYKSEKQRRIEFYEKIKDNEKAEFINGKIIMHSPVKLQHNFTGKLILSVLDAFVEKHDLGFVGYEKLLISLTRNDYEPDICFFLKEKSDKFRKDQMQFPAPDLIVEILSNSTEKIDRGIKFIDYASHGVKEYWIVDSENEFVEQYISVKKQFELKSKIENGMIKSVVIKNFAIDIRAFFDKKINRESINEITK